MLEEYTNPENTEEIIKQLHECKNFFEVQEFIQNVFPNFIISQAEDYSSDYSYLTDNWKALCSAMHVKPQFIVIVDFIPLVKPEYSLLHKFLDTMTRNGFVVRRKEEIILCKRCKKALISKELYKSLKYIGCKKIPTSWRNMCRSCIYTT